MALAKASSSAHDAQYLREIADFGELVEPAWEDLQGIHLARRDGTWKKSDPEAVARWYNDRILAKVVIEVAVGRTEALSEHVVHQRFLGRNRQSEKLLRSVHRIDAPQLVQPPRRVRRGSTLNFADMVPIAIK